MKYLFIGVPIICLIVAIVIRTRDVILINNGWLVGSRNLQYSLLFLIAITSLAIFIAGNNNAFVNKSMSILFVVCLLSLVMSLCVTYLLYELPDFLFHKPRFYVTVDPGGKMKVDVLYPVFFAGTLLIVYLVNFLCLIVTILSPKISQM
ncbi:MULTISPECIES: hypothetical protein [Niastella]|uniref:Uncharacterized protein n=1 Tax=Niastella soli TaxID=2821487 RepID=A0ABS3Z4Y7_9BACT|nr:hypothetical protein [Niastella soli]MBO9205235.1 hypothetical protein [Niastella soli]